jgi:hypothetical protein
MCGRVTLDGDFAQLRVAFGIPDDSPPVNYARIGNVAAPDSRSSVTKGPVSLNQSAS